MKIYILPVDTMCRPSARSMYSAHHNGYGIEQDMQRWLLTHPEYVTTEPKYADWHYLPVFWTNYQVQNDYGKKNMDVLSDLVTPAILEPEKTFTICQYSGGPLIDLPCEVRVYLASRDSSTQGVDAPLLCAPHKISFRRKLYSARKKYRASFIGRLDTHTIRNQMCETLLSKQDVKIVDGNLGTNSFVKLLL